MIGLPSLLGGKMATTSLVPLHAGKGRTVGNAISDIIDYVKNPDKTDADFKSMVDDMIKEVNDKLGREAGDEGSR